MKLMLKAIPLLAGILTPLLTLAQASSEQNLTGVVSDAMCGSTHMMKDKPAAECLRHCVKQGIKYAAPSSRVKTCTCSKDTNRSSINTPHRKSG